MPGEGELILRLLFAAALAGALGLERELTEQPAGFRTHILVGLGSGLFTVISAYGFQALAGQSPNTPVRADVTRIASQIVVGIGFLGGGAILKYGGSVRGLTTAASLWVTAAIGMAVGLGALALGSATTGIALVALVGLRPLRGLVRRHAAVKDEFVLETDREVDIKSLVDRVVDAGGELRELRIVEDDGSQQVHLYVRLGHRSDPAHLASALAGTPHVRNIEWGR